jgi:hypothetical protein
MGDTRVGYMNFLAITRLVSVDFECGTVEQWADEKQDVRARRSPSE